MTRILLVRHGLTEWNAVGRWQGWSDAPLSDVGLQQARAAADAVGAVDVIVSSDLSRAVVTAEIIGEAIGVGPVEVDPRLRERGGGDYEGLTREEILERYPDAFDRSPVEPPGGEPIDVLWARVHEALRHLSATYDGADVLAVSHGGVIRQVERHLGIDLHPVPNLGGRWIEVDGDGRLRSGERVLLIGDDAPVTVPRAQ